MLSSYVIYRAFNGVSNDQMRAFFLQLEMLAINTHNIFDNAYFKPTKSF